MRVKNSSDKELLGLKPGEEKDIELSHAIKMRDKLVSPAHLGLEFVGFVCNGEVLWCEPKEPEVDPQQALKDAALELLSKSHDELVSMAEELDLETEGSKKELVMRIVNG